MSDPIWTDVCEVDEIAAEDVIRFDLGGRTFAIYPAPDGSAVATDGVAIAVNSSM